MGGLKKFTRSSQRNYNIIQNTCLEKNSMSTPSKCVWSIFYHIYPYGINRYVNDVSLLLFGISNTV